MGEDERECIFKAVAFTLLLKRGWCVKKVFEENTLSDGDICVSPRSERRRRERRRGSHGAGRVPQREEVHGDGHVGSVQRGALHQGVGPILYIIHASHHRAHTLYYYVVS